MMTPVKETIYAAAFRQMLENSCEPRLITDVRRRAYAFFTEQGFPSVKSEDWKYTNVAPIAAAAFRIEPGRYFPNTIETDFQKLFENFNFGRSGFAALNAAFATPQIVRIPKASAVDRPFEFSFASGTGAASFPHVLVIAETGSKATIVEDYNGSGFTNSAIQIIVEDNANVTHYRVQKEGREAFHVGTTEVNIGRDGVYNSTNINVGGAISRHDIDVKFTAEGGEAFVDGLYMLDGTQHADTHSIIDHQVANCTSHQNYKGVLNGKSRAVFNGKVFVRENASGTDAKQSNKNLLLSNDARVDTKPQLEIFNDDVKCAHGATVGQLDDEELFYLLTRGLPENLAKNLLTYGFAEEIISKIDIRPIKKDLDEFVLNRLNVRLEK